MRWSPRYSQVEKAWLCHVVGWNVGMYDGAQLMSWGKAYPGSWTRGVSFVLVKAWEAFRKRRIACQPALVHKICSWWRDCDARIR